MRVLRPQSPLHMWRTFPISPISSLTRCVSSVSPNRAASLSSPNAADGVRAALIGPLRRAELLSALARLLERDATLGPRLLESLSGDTLRLMLVIGTAQEYFGQEAVEDQLRSVDTDLDDSISSQEYNAWVESAVRTRAMDRTPNEQTIHKTTTTTTTAETKATKATVLTAAARVETATIAPSTATASTTAATTTTTAADTATATAAAAPTVATVATAAPSTSSRAPSATTATSSVASTLSSSCAAPEHEQGRGKLSWPLWRRIALSAAVPFVAFGMLDNAIFVTVGDAIDKGVADTFGLTTMAAAALGGVVSGTAGIQVHGLAERLAQRFPFAREPTLTPAQRVSKAHGRATQWGNSIGMVMGLLIGMTPLILLSPSAS